MPPKTQPIDPLASENHETLLRLHEELLRVRHAELALAERYKQQEMRTPTHFGVGQEAVAVGVCAALEKTDVAYSHHRSHNHFLAKGGSVYRLAAELFGRETGCSRGRGGSVHLTDLSCGFVASSAILGEAMSAATGSALAFRLGNEKRIATAFFGDAVAEEGAFYECLSYAALKKLPVLYVCENNGYATESPLSIRQPAGADISGRVASFGVRTIKAEGNDVLAVLTAAREAVAYLRTEGTPVFLECATYRWLEHVGPFYDHELGRTYRTEQEVAGWQDKCPVIKSRAAILEAGAADEATLDKMQTDIQAVIQADIEKAYGDPWPDPQQLFDNIY
ncbi:MAG: thiamine pyrophosphate-dependent dehydrogenase E1 component subunit alpha [Kordiimonadaceae bacterium]|nr:thiamine pyrophosphate-dependent dehydrogenase E1 component subunit alpha [Kordiimonadaceae bacterium]MBO6568429.1 thiamine pyrophosphate-dependent dehydrogenase E1 component subunit alpha [Kordiimonadaceae bacterium]MBO6963842.1 thiamine pyrophosphate-dependent dehydrogenase E1 component subunit alpha [Kordiimonadaceae bacterium]